MHCVAAKFSKLHKNIQECSTVGRTPRKELNDTKMRTMLTNSKTKLLCSQIGFPSHFAEIPPLMYQPLWKWDCLLVFTSELLIFTL